tara:strand:+ start:1140 stop:1307 length:168 start_codon:yes stop_codon:yes gene_type:complete
MFFFFVGLLCGVVLCQEIPTIPKIKPYLNRVWNKLNPLKEGTSPENNSEGSSKDD